MIGLGLARASGEGVVAHCDMAREGEVTRDVRFVILLANSPGCAVDSAPRRSATLREFGEGFPVDRFES